MAALQRAAGNAAIARSMREGRVIRRLSPDDDRIIQLVIDGVQAFEALAAAYPMAGPDQEAPAIPEGAPAGLRPALERLRTAKKYRHGAGLTSARDVVIESLAPKGPAGMLEMFLTGERLELQEQLRRATVAKAEGRPPGPCWPP
jgi:hypothetical protein